MINNHRVVDPKSQAVHLRTEELDALDAILPFDRRHQLAALLTDDDVATLKHPGGGMGEDTLRALASDLGDREAWCQLAIGSACPPLAGAEGAAAHFVAHQLWGPRRWEADTVRRHLANWSTLTKWRSLDVRLSWHQSRLWLVDCDHSDGRPRLRQPAPQRGRRPVAEALGCRRGSDPHRGFARDIPGSRRSRHSSS